MAQWVTPDDTGFTIRTRYTDTEQVLEHNKVLRDESPATFREAGTVFHKVCSVPAEVMDMLYRKLGRMPTPQELVALSQDRDYNKLKTREVKL